MKSSRYALSTCITIICALPGCARDVNPLNFSPAPYVLGPRSYLTEDEINHVVNSETLISYLSSGVEHSRDARNSFITAKMFVIDQSYNAYETALSKEHDFSSFFGRIAVFGLTTAGSAIPVGQTTKILSAVATGVGATRDAFNEEVLLKQTIQTIQSQMRTDRAKQAKLMLSRMSCPIAQYPFYMALSDLEAYNQAGRFESALANLSKSVAIAEVKATGFKEGGPAMAEAVSVAVAASAAEDAPCPIAARVAVRR